MSTIFIITGHGNYGTGIKSNLDFIAGDHPDVYAVDFLTDHTELDLITQFQTIIASHPQLNVIFICDLLGGTPFRAAASLSTYNEQYEVVCGCSMGAIIELLFMKDTLAPDVIADLLVEKSKESCLRFLDLKSKPLDEMNLEDGI
ncbi:MAG: PTS sugar transporter subunit IIA [Turicibacter sp.]